MNLSWIHLLLLSFVVTCTNSRHYYFRPKRQIAEGLGAGPSLQAAMGMSTHGMGTTGMSSAGMSPLGPEAETTGARQLSAMQQQSTTRFPGSGMMYGGGLYMQRYPVGEMIMMKPNLGEAMAMRSMNMNQNMLGMMYRGGGMNSGPMMSSSNGMMGTSGNTGMMNSPMMNSNMMGGPSRMMNSPMMGGGGMMGPSGMMNSPMMGSSAMMNSPMMGSSGMMNSPMMGSTGMGMNSQGYIMDQNPHLQTLQENGSKMLYNFG